MSAHRLTIPIFALLVAVFCGELHAGVILLVSDEMQVGLQNTTSQTAAVTGGDRQEGESDPFVDGDPSTLECLPDEPGTQVVPVACETLQMSGCMTPVACQITAHRWMMFPSPIPLELLKVPISMTVRIV